MSRSVDCAAVGDGKAAQREVISKSGGMYYGWVILSVATAALIATSPAQTFGVSIFNEAMRGSLGLTHSQYAGAYMLGTLLAALPLPLIGAWMDRQGPRRTTAAVVALFGLACLVTSLAGGWLSLFVAFFLLRLLGPGALAFLSSNALAFWFHRRLGTAEGIRQLGYALALVMIPLVYLWLLQNFGWRGSYLILGLAIWLIMLPLVVGFFRDRPEAVGQTLEDADDQPRAAKGGSDVADWGFTLREAVCTRAGWIVALGTALYSLVHTAVFFCVVPICQEYGLAETDAAGMLSAFAISLAVMHLVGGVLADRLPANVLLAIGMAGLAMAMFIVLRMWSPWLTWVAGGVLGASQGVFFATSNPLCARYFGRAHLGKIRGSLTTLKVAASSAGPLLAGLSRDYLGSFYPAILAFAVLPLVVALLSLLATAPVRPEWSEEPS